jgi:hypothetical protein
MFTNLLYFTVFFLKYQIFIYYLFQDSLLVNGRLKRLFLAPELEITFQSQTGFCYIFLSSDIKFYVSSKAWSSQP